MLRISHDNKGASAGWFLDSVTVDIPSRGDHVVFPCHRWLADDEDDGKIERELFPGQQIHTNPSNCRFLVSRQLSVEINFVIVFVLCCFALWSS